MTTAQLEEIARDVWAAESDSILQLIRETDYGVLRDVVEATLRCRENKGRILAAGVGTSAVVARKIAHTFSCVGIPAFYLSPAGAAHGTLGAVQEGDVVIAISKGGDTQEIVNLLPAVKAKKALLIGVTEKEGSQLAKASDIVVKVRVSREPDPFNMLATASTLAVLAVFDAVAIALMRATGYTKEEFAVNHPGGDVGRRLKEGE
jgi:KpsF/GutQ family protein